MTAPALIVFAPGPVDASSSRTVREIVRMTRQMRPDLRLDAAFGEGTNTLATAVRALTARGAEEIVVVPLLVAPSERADAEVSTAVQAAATAHPQAHLRTSDIIGADASLLPILDERLRSALKAAKVRELDALVIAAAGASDPRVGVAMSRLSRLWSTRHHLPTSIAFADSTPPSTGDAVRDWKRRGKRHVAVGSLFIASGPQASRAADLAREAGACAVSAPLGAHEELSRLIVSRYSVGALELVPV